MASKKCPPGLVYSARYGKCVDPNFLKLSMGAQKRFTKATQNEKKKKK